MEKTKSERLAPSGLRARMKLTTVDPMGMVRPLIRSPARSALASSTSIRPSQPAWASKHGYGGAITFIIAGVFAANINLALPMLVRTFGINIPGYTP